MHCLNQSCSFKPVEQVNFRERLVFSNFRMKFNDVLLLGFFGGFFVGFFFFSFV